MPTTSGALVRDVLEAERCHHQGRISTPGAGPDAGPVRFAQNPASLHVEVVRCGQKARGHWEKEVVLAQKARVWESKAVVLAAKEAALAGEARISAPKEVVWIAKARVLEQKAVVLARETVVFGQKEGV